MIRDYPKSEMPREKLDLQGLDVLSNSELIALVIRTGNKNQDVLALSKNLLSKNGLDNLARMSLIELSSLLGNVKACQLMAAFELGRRSLSLEPAEKPVISKSQDVARLIGAQLCSQKQELFYALFLDTRLRLIKIKLLFKGTLNSSIIHPREIFAEAMFHGADSIILVHNHPSGSEQPSEEDINITRKLQAIGELTGIKVIDHVIIGRKKYSSLNSLMRQS